MGSYILNQFPSIVMFGMKGFYVSASGVIQGHYGPLVKNCDFFFYYLPVTGLNVTGQNKFALVGLASLLLFITLCNMQH